MRTTALDGPKKERLVDAACAIFTNGLDDELRAAVTVLTLLMRLKKESTADPWGAVRLAGVAVPDLGASGDASEKPAARRPRILCDLGGDWRQDFPCNTERRLARSGERRASLIGTMGETALSKPSGPSAPPASGDVVLLRLECEPLVSSYKVSLAGSTYPASEEA